MEPQPYLSVVLPVYNENKTIGILIREISSVIETVIRKPYEIIVADDASDDGSVEAAQEAAPAAATLHIIKAVARSGQSATLMRGIAAAAGELIVTMDADLQHDPADIPSLLDKINGRDMICGIRKTRSDGAFRALCSKIANAFRNLVTGDSTEDSGCTFRVMRKECITTLLPLQWHLFGCEFFFHPVFLRCRGFKVGQCEISHKPRASGNSKYRLMQGRLMRGVAACIWARYLLGRIKKRNR
jgi:dolichol-phosphate mannosyltransferase